MKAIGLVLPSLPKAFIELFSQFRRRKKLLLSHPVFEVSEDFFGNLGDVRGHARVEWINLEVRGSYSNRLLYSERVLAIQQEWLTARDWSKKEIRIVKMQGEQFILQNWPELKVRPFPDETFTCELRFPLNHKVKIPYLPVKS